MVSRSRASGQFVRSESVMARYLSKIDTSGGPNACHLWTGGVFENGYGRLSLNDSARSSVRSHRWGYAALVGPVPRGLIVRHTCDTPLCHNPRHWVLGTGGDNSRDMVERSRSLRGSTNPFSTLTEIDVLVIKRDLLPLVGSGKGRRGTITLNGIGSLYGVTGGAIASIRAGRTWGHVVVEAGALDD